MYFSKTLTTLNSIAPLDVNDINGGAAVQFESGDGTIEIVGTVNGTVWVVIPVKNINSGASANSMNAAGIYSFEVVGLVRVGVRLSAAGTTGVKFTFNLNKG